MGDLFPNLSRSLTRLACVTDPSAGASLPDSQSGIPVSSPARQRTSVRAFTLSSESTTLLLSSLSTHPYILSLGPLLCGWRPRLILVDMKGLLLWSSSRNVLRDPHQGPTKAIPPQPGQVTITQDDSSWTLGETQGTAT